MIYLIGQLSPWLLLAATFAGLAGWSLATLRAQRAERTLQRTRANLLSDLARLAAGDGGSAPEAMPDPMQSRADIADGRIAELERALETARARAESASAELAELQRRQERDATDTADLARLRAAEEERGREIEIAAAPAAPSEEETALQGWRLRYFEHRVRYLESQARAASSSVAAEAQAPTPPAHEALAFEWRAREAEARAAYLEQSLRGAAASAAVVSEPEAAPFASNADVDALLRWRMLYLERRAAHLQAAPRRAEALLSAAAGERHPSAPDPDRWKWRARYLEARVRHLEQRTAPAPTPERAVAVDALAADLAAPIVSAPAAEAETAETAPPPPVAPRGAKPPVLSAPRNGAPDDLTLIDGVSLLQQTTLHSMGVFHFDQIARWTPDNVGWVDHYLRLRGRIAEEAWVEQARDLAHDGATAARRDNHHDELWRG